MSKPRKDAGLSGMLGAAVKVRKVRGQVVVSSRTPRPRVPTEKEEAVRARFTQASQYANQQKSDAQSNTLYAKGITEKKRSVYMVAMSDYLNVPTVNSIDTLDYHGVIGDTITVQAVDDFMVTRVKVSILDASGAIIEQGDAGPDTLKVNLWAYKATAGNPSLSGTTIKAIAYDRPGNTGTAEVVL